jgi:hypothetical protein
MPYRRLDVNRSREHSNETLKPDDSANDPGQVRERCLEVLVRTGMIGPDLPSGVPG